MAVHLNINSIQRSVYMLNAYMTARCDPLTVAETEKINYNQ